MAAAAADDESRRKREKPAASCVEAARLARELYGIECDESAVSKLDSYDDNNFKLCDRTGGVEFVLKIHNGVETDNMAIIEAQVEACRRICAHAGCWAPESLASNSGACIELVSTLPNVAGTPPRTHAVRLLPFKRAQLLADVDPEPALMAETGRMLARVSRALAGLDGPARAACTRAHAWDVRTFPQNVQPFLGCVHEGEERALVEGALARFDESAAPLDAKLPRQVIHGDLNDQNILVSPADDAGGTYPVGVIDFGDLVETWRVCDLAIALAYMLISCHYDRRAHTASAERTWQACAGLCRAYNAELPLSEAEWGALPALIGARLATSLVFGTYSSSLEPENAYLTLSLRPGWRALKLLSGKSADEVRQLLSRDQ